VLGDVCYLIAHQLHWRVLAVDAFLYVRVAILHSLFYSSVKFDVAAHSLGLQPVDIEMYTYVCKERKLPRARCDWPHMSRKLPDM